MNNNLIIDNATSENLSKATINCQEKHRLSSEYYSYKDETRICQDCKAENICRGCNQTSKNLTRVDCECGWICKSEARIMYFREKGRRNWTFDNWRCESHSRERAEQIKERQNKSK